ncbi:MAG: Hg(II)-responsive transcriptional regulator [Burkholderiales bacterium]
MGSNLTIGKVARTAGVNVETVRYYERVNLLRQPPRPLAGIRRYAADAVERIRFIKRAQELGFALAEIKRLLALQEAQSCGAARALAAQKLTLVEARIMDLQRMRGVLKELIGRCDARRGKVSCPIIKTLQKQ